MHFLNTLTTTQPLTCRLSPCPCLIVRLFSQTPQQPQQQQQKQWDCVFTNDVRWGKNTEGQQTVNEYVLLEELGRGSYGRVRLCERRVGDGIKEPWRRFAMKIVSKPRLRRLSEYVNVPSGGMRKITAEDKVRAQRVHSGLYFAMCTVLRLLQYGYVDCCACGYSGDQLGAPRTRVLDSLTDTRCNACVEPWVS